MGPFGVSIRPAAEGRPLLGSANKGILRCVGRSTVCTLSGLGNSCVSVAISPVSRDVNTEGNTICGKQPLPAPLAAGQPLFRELPLAEGEAEPPWKSQSGRFWRKPRFSAVVSEDSVAALTDGACAGPAASVRPVYRPSPAQSVDAAGVPRPASESAGGAAPSAGAMLLVLHRHHP